MDREQALESGGTDDFESAPTAPLTQLRRGTPYQLCAVSPTTKADGDFQAQGVKLNRLFNGKHRTARQRRFISGRERCVIL